MVSTRIRRSLLVALFAAILVTLPAATALAANPGKTFTFHNQVDTFVDVLPCTDIPYQITTTSNGVMHFQLRTLPDGTVVAPFTFTVRGTGSDGSRIFQHQTGHINQNPLGATNEFFKHSCAA